MFFSRSHRFKSSRNAAEIKSCLLGNHVKIHDMDFEISDHSKYLRMIPHAEEVSAVKTLPITHIELKEKGSETLVTVKSKMRKIDSGGPVLIVIFCFVMLATAIFFFAFGGPEYKEMAYTIGGLSIVIFIIFWVKMETGYFDYIRKIRDYLKKQCALPTA